jgi:hypothetical protein
MWSEPRGKPQNYSPDEHLKQWETLRHFHLRLTQISGEEENIKIEEFLDYIEELLSVDSCPPHFLLGVTSTKAEFIKQTWDDIKHRCKSESRESNYVFLMKKLSTMKNIDEVINYVRSGIFSNSENATEKNKPERFSKLRRVSEETTH